MGCVRIFTLVEVLKGGGGVRIPVPSIEIIQNPSPDMKKGKIPSLEAVVPLAQHAMAKDHC